MLLLLLTGLLLGVFRGFDCKKEYEELIELHGRKISIPDAIERTKRRGIEVLNHGLFIIHAKYDHHRLNDHLDEDIDEFRMGRNTYLMLVDESNHENLLSSSSEGPNELLFAEEYLAEDKTCLDFSRIGGSFEALLEIVWYGDVGVEAVSDVGSIDGVEVVSYAFHFMDVKITHNHHGALEKLKSMKRVVRIGAKHREKTHNYHAKGIIQGKYDVWSSDFSLHDNGLTGKGYIIGIADTGLDWKSSFFHDPSYGTSIKIGEVMPTHRKIYYYEIADGAVAGEKSECEHGTHVCGSAAGKVFEGAANHDKLSKFSGPAEDSRIYFTDMGGEGKGLSVPSDIYKEMFLPAYRAGVRIHSNSWGSSIPVDCKYDCNCTLNDDTEYSGKMYYKGDVTPKGWCKDIYGIPTDRCCEFANQYNMNAFLIDLFSYDYDEMLILVAAGNDGELSEKKLVGAPSTSANCLSVGNSQTTSEGYVDSQRWIENAKYYTDWASEYCSVTVSTVTECCALTPTDDCMVEDIEKCCPFYDSVETIKANTTKLYNMTNLAWSSSKGPTWDGRLKPDVVSPGDLLTSANSMGADESVVHSGDFDGDIKQRAMCSMSGTSMATPMLAGTTVLVRQYFEQGYYPSGTPKDEDKMSGISGNLVKTVVVHSGTMLTGFVKNGGQWKELFDTSVNPMLWKIQPNYIQGFGLPKVGEALKLPGSRDGYAFNVVDRVDIKHRETHVYRFKFVGTSYYGDYLAKVTLGWYDRPNKVWGFASQQLLSNDLDLVFSVFSPGDKKANSLRGNNAFSPVGDGKNNLERVIVPKADEPPPPGTVFNVTVFGYNVVDRINYALVMSGYGIACLQENADINTLCSTCKPGWTNGWRCDQKTSDDPGKHDDNNKGGSSSGDSKESSSGNAGVIVGSVLGGTSLFLMLLCTICVCGVICCLFGVTAVIFLVSIALWALSVSGFRLKGFQKTGIKKGGNYSKFDGLNDKMLVEGGVVSGLED